jgi:hypothetical protein
MQKEQSQAANVESRPRLRCSGIWGGIRNRDIEISAGKVMGSIYSQPVAKGAKVETFTTLGFVRAA